MQLCTPKHGGRCQSNGKRNAGLSPAGARCSRLPATCVVHEIIQQCGDDDNANEYAHAAGPENAAEGSCAEE